MYKLVGYGYYWSILAYLFLKTLFVVVCSIYIAYMYVGSYTNSLPFKKDNYLRNTIHMFAIMPNLGSLNDISGKQYNNKEKNTDTHKDLFPQEVRLTAGV